MEQEELERVNTFIRRIGGGDKSALSNLYKHMAKPLYCFLYPILLSRETVEDIIQETFIRVLKKAKSFFKPINGKAWIFKIAQNLAYTYLRKRKRELERIEILDVGLSDSRQAEQCLESSADRKLFIECLNPRDRQITILREQGFLYGEIAHILGIAEITVIRHIRAIRVQADSFFGEKK